MPDQSPAEEIYFCALEIGDPRERTAYLDRACHQDVALRRRVERLLAAAARVGGFLEEPAIHVMQLVPAETPPGYAGDTGPDRTGPPVAGADDPPRDVSVTRYELGEEIGRGGMGRVLLGRDTDLNRDVAVKVLLDAHRGRADLAERFMQEARIAGRLQHPGIVPVYEMGRLADQTPFFSMKLVEGKTLAVLLAERRHPDQDQARFLGTFLQVCQTLAYAHSRGVIHRDVKPANVMVGEFGEVQVMDWGVARVLAAGAGGEVAAAATSASDDSPASRDGRLTAAGVVVGTPAYMAPEQARREHQRDDPRSDVFGLGGILCEILTGQPPFRGENLAGVLIQSLGRDLSDAYARLESCGAEPELVALAKSCVAASPDDRPADAGAVAGRVSTYLDGVKQRLQQAEVGRAKAEARAEGEHRRRVLTLSLAGAVLLVVAGGGVAAWLGQQRLARQREDEAKAGEAVDRGRALLDEGWENQDRARLAQARREFERAVELSRTEVAAALLPEAVSRTERVGRNQRLMDSLLDVTAPREPRRDADDGSGRPAEGVQKGEDEQYADAFRAWGLDPEGTDHATALARFRSEPRVVQDGVVAALDRWALVRRLNGDTVRWQTLAKLADDLDPDEDRRQLRSLVLASGWRSDRASVWQRAAGLERGDVLARLEQLRARVGPAQPTLTVLLLAWASGRAGDPAGAERVLRQALAVRPDDVVLMNALGKVLERQGPTRLADAIGCHRAARAIRPGLGVALAQALLRTGRPEDARDAAAVFHDLVGRQPDNPDLRFYYGYVLHVQDRLDEAGAEYREAIRLRPAFPAAFNNLGALLIRQNRLTEALEACREALRRKPDYGDAHMTLGHALRLQGRHREAVAAYREAVRAAPDTPETHLNLGAGLAQLKDPAAQTEALAVCREAVRLKPDSVMARLNLGVVLQKQNRLAEAADEYREAVRLQPDSATAHFSLGTALQSQSRPADALAEFREAIRLKPDYADAHFRLGRLLQAQGKSAEAAAAHRAAIRHKPDLADAHVDLGYALQLQGNLPEAEACYREALRLQPESHVAHNNLARLSHLQGKLPEAIAGFREAIRHRPDYPDAHMNLGSMFKEQNQLPDAVREYQETIRLKPDFAEAHCNLGHVLILQGKFSESAEAFRRGHELGSKRPGWTLPSATWLKQAERNAELDARLPALLQGAERPKDAAERIELAQICRLKGAPAHAVRFYEEAFEADRKLANTAPYRFRAACAAALAAAGAAGDTPGEQERVRLRSQALEWLRADVASMRKGLDGGNPQARRVIAQLLAQWGSTPDLASVRDAAALARLPRPEQEAWQTLWAEVEPLRRQAAGK
ncbi:MAG: tetratricopeptide repeat protein [Gemmataceae bacterium]